MDHKKKYPTKNKFQEYGLKVPEHYFDSIEHKILNQLEAQQSSTSSMHKIRSLLWPSIAAAAALLLVWSVYQLNESSSVISASVVTLEPSLDDINAYASVALNESELLATLNQEDVEVLYTMAQEWDNWGEEALELDYLFTEFQLMN